MKRPPRTPDTDPEPGPVLEPDDAPHEPTPTQGWRRLHSSVTGGAGLLGGVSCTVSMTLAMLGLVGTAAVQAGHSAGDMAGMTATSGPAVHSSDPVLAFFIDHGPTILIVSAVLVVFSLGVRRRWFVVPALVVGALMYWGMYAQSSVTVMYVASGIGILVWILLFVAVGSARSIRLVDLTG